MEEKTALKRSFQPIWPFLRPYRKAMIIAPAFKFVEAVLELITPLVVADIIDTGLIGGAGDSYVITRCVLMLVLAAVGYASALVCQITASKVSQGFGTSLRTGLWDKVLALPAAKRDIFGGATLVTRMTQDINQLQTAVAMLLRLVVRAPFLVIGAIVMSFLVDAKLAVLFVLAGLLVGLLLYFVMGRTIPLYAKLQKKLDKLGLHTAEQLEGVRVIRAFGRQKSVQDTFLQQADDFSTLAVRVGRLSALLQPGIYLVLNLAVVGLLWLGGLRVNTGSLQAGQILAMVSYMTQISLAMVVVANLVVLFTKAFASLDRVDELLTISTISTTSIPSAAVPDGQPHGAKPSAGDADMLSVRHLCFSYTDTEAKKAGTEKAGTEKAGAEEAAVLEDINFTGHVGETIGIIGGTGSGKSTLIKLILGFYPPTSGEIEWKGRSVASYPDEELRQQMGYVPQKATLFSGTIRSNLTWGHEGADDNTLWRALKTAQGAEVVQKKPGGLDFVLEPEGRNLSGGQRQRLTIARALAGNPALLILDDSASALDFATDAALRRALAEDAGQRLTLVISQRYPALRHADRILVLCDGKAVGFDTHDHLLLHCPAYRDICASQGAKLPPYQSPDASASGAAQAAQDAKDARTDTTKGGALQ